MAATILGAILAFGFGLVAWMIKRSDRKAEERDADRDEREELVLKSIDANGCVIKELYECRFHDKPANGDLENAYKYQNKVKHELEDYMRRRASK